MQHTACLPTTTMATTQRRMRLKRGLFCSGRIWLLFGARCLFVCVCVCVRARARDRLGLAVTLCLVRVAVLVFCWRCVAMPLRWCFFDMVSVCLRHGRGAPHVRSVCVCAPHVCVCARAARCCGCAQWAPPPTSTQTRAPRRSKGNSRARRRRVYGGAGRKARAVGGRG